MPTKPTISRPKILCVDDHEKNLIALEVALGGLDIDVIPASSGRRALSEIERSEFAAILLDVQMPVMDGFETAKRIRKHKASAATPIIFVTAMHKDDEIAKYAYDLGAVDYLYKPLNPEILKAKVGVFCELYRKSKEIEQHAADKRELALTKELLRARDEFLSIASHELKTPLSPLNINLQTFREFFELGRIHEIPREKVTRMLNTALNQVDRLSRLVSALLDVSQIIEGRLMISRDRTDLSHLIQEICQTFDHEIRKARSDLKIELGSDLVGHWDRARLEQVIVNLLTNALKYGEGKPICIRAFSEKEDVRISVEDEGIGIAQEDQQRIFERFERAASSRNYGGLGLGLYITRRLVELHQGRISVESSPGKGTIFSVSLPKAMA